MAREASRRATCASNLRQLILGQHHYADVYGVFPGTDRGLFHPRVSPFVGLRAGETRPTLMMCPSDPLAGQARYQWYSYYGNNGLTTADPGDGFLGYQMRIFIRPRDITDGLSSTSAISERLSHPEWEGRSVDWDNFPELWIRRLRMTENRYQDPADIADECMHRAGRPVVYWEEVRFYNHIVPPNGNTCSNGRPAIPAGLFSVSARSLHSGGVNVAMGDGSVRFVSQSLGRDVWWALGTRSGNEAVSF
jgi:prepilin-type processing-associated H-X9-DG protein